MEILAKSKKPFLETDFKMYSFENTTSTLILTLKVMFAIKPQNFFFSSKISNSGYLSWNRSDDRNYRFESNDLYIINDDEDYHLWFDVLLFTRRRNVIIFLLL